MRRKKKQPIGKVFLFLILAGLFTWYLLVTGDKNLGDKPVDSSTPSEPSNPDTEKPNIPDVTPEPEPTTYLNKITYTVNVDKEIEDIIVEYMDVYYKSMKELKEYDMTYLFNNNEQANINQTAVSLLVEIRKLKPNDLSLSSAKYDLDFKEVSNSNGKIYVKVLENNYLRFKFMNDIESKVYNISNEFTIEKVNGEYKISKYNKVQDFFVMISDKYEGGGTSSLNTIKNNYLTKIKQNVIDEKEDYQDFLNGTGITRRSCDHTYDRSKALNYALSWVNKRNPDWIKFDSNCQNFASQMVNAGGVPMDIHGSAEKQWKLYSSSYNSSETESGLVYSWTYVPSFMEYAKTNTGYGLCASVDVNMYYAEAGDVIHVGTTGPTRHALVVIGTYKKDGKVVDVLVNSNTVDLENYPMSAYVYPYSSLIKIYGWND